MDASYTGQQIARLRKELGLTQKELAEKLHITDKAVSKWERGINFPDLGLMEALAESLQTTPAVLLGLEDATQEELVSSFAEISEDLLEDARRDARILGWGSILAAVLLVLVYSWIPHHGVQAYQTLHCVIIAVALAGLYLLVKYGEIRKWDLAEYLICYGAAFPVLVFLGIQLVTGSNPHPVLGAVLIILAACCIQWLFCRIMRAKFAKAIPVILSAGIAVQDAANGLVSLEFMLPVICCLVVWVFWLIKKRK